MRHLGDGLIGQAPNVPTPANWWADRLVAADPEHNAPKPPCARPWLGTPASHGRVSVNGRAALREQRRQTADVAVGKMMLLDGLATCESLRARRAAVVECRAVVTCVREARLPPLENYGSPWRRPSVTLNIVGYQFPDADDPRTRFSWHVISGAAVGGEGKWTFRWQALTCDESARLAVWLRHVADWLDSDSSRTVASPPSPRFTEPNLALSMDRGVAQDGATLRVGLDQEFLPPWSTEQRPHELHIPVTAHHLRDAAADWEADLARYPDGPATQPAPQQVASSSGAVA
jgi:hypothetical protein